MPNCKQCHSQFEITDRDREFYEKIDVPAPTWCPECRQIRRLLWRNERTLYQVKCVLCNKQIISSYDANGPYQSVCVQCYYSDKWNPLRYGQDFDFNRPFFEQFDELMKKTPQLNTVSEGNENCDYSNCIGHSKDCYLCFASWESEKTMYSRWSFQNKECADVFRSKACQLSYELINSVNCYNTQHVQDSENCTDSFFLENCKNCINCFGCKNLNNKENQIFNKPATDTEIAVVKEKLRSCSGREEFKKKSTKFFITLPHKASHNKNAFNSTGDYLFNCDNCTECRSGEKGENLQYLYEFENMKDCMDCNMHQDSELLYENVSGAFSNRSLFCSISAWTNFSYYSSTCIHSDYMFGSVSAPKLKHCILNKQYSEKKYNELVPRIIAHMRETGEFGEFFPSKIAPFAFNEALSIQFFSKTKEETITEGWLWKDNIGGTYGKETIKTVAIPDCINDVARDIIQEVLGCAECGKNYKIIKQELDFYQKQGIPIPHKCPDCRFARRMVAYGIESLTNSTCDKCQKKIQTTYAPDRPEIVYCEECYRKEVY